MKVSNKYVITAMVTWITGFLNVAPCRPVEIWRVPWRWKYRIYPNNRV